jgi:hypothetical protein
MKFTIAALSLILIGFAPAHAESTKADVCQKVVAVLRAHLEANEDVAKALSALKITGDSDQRARAETLFDAVAENQRLLIEGIYSIVELCTDN